MSALPWPCDDAAIRSAPQAAQCRRAVERAVLAAAIIGSSMTFVDGTVVNVALPVLRQSLGAGVSEVQWIVESYMLFLASLILVGGALGDRWGRRRVFAGGVLLFAMASAWCGLAPDAPHLIVARGVQGVGAALLVPGSLALISASFSRQHRGRAIGTWAAWTSIAAGVGPLAGGWLVEHLSWRWIFFLNLPFAVLVLMLVWLRVPETRGGTRPGPIDWPGAALVTLGLFGLVYGLIRGGAEGFDTAAIASLAVGLAALAVFGWLELRTAHPMVPPALFRSPGFTGANLITLFLYAGLGAILFVLPFHLIQRRGYSPVEAAAALLPFVATMFLLSRWAGGLLDRYGARLPLTLGPVIAGLGFWLFVPLAGRGSYWTEIFPAVLVMSLGMAVTVAPLTATVMTSVEEAHTGLASGVNNAVSRVAMLLAVATVGLVAGARLHQGLDPVAWLAAGLALGGAAAAGLIIPGARPSRPR
jgi:EmrB/QacA subfamily drug resistance transporter